MRIQNVVRSVALAAACVLSASSNAAITDFYETFASGAQSWRNSNGASVLNWTASGGPDGGAYVTSVFNLSGTSAGGFPPTVIRAQSNFGSSGGAYVGNWIAAGVTGVSFQFRHNLSESITVTGRFATPANNPGASVVSSLVVAPNTWTLVSFDLREGSPDFVSLGGGTYAGIFSNIGNMQLGFTVPAPLAGQNIDGGFDLTNFAVVPAPAAAALALLAVPGFGGRRRR